MALCRDLEIAGSHRRNDRSARGDDPWHRVDARRRACQLDGDRRDRRRATGDCRVAVVHQRNLLTA